MLGTRFGDTVCQFRRPSERIREAVVASGQLGVSRLESRPRIAPQPDAPSPDLSAPTGLEAVWLVTALLVPLWVNLWAHHPFELSKVLLLRSAAWLLAGLWVSMGFEGTIVCASLCAAMPC